MGRGARAPLRVRTDRCLRRSHVARKHHISLTTPRWISLPPHGKLLYPPLALSSRPPYRHSSSHYIRRQRSSRGLQSNTLRSSSTTTFSWIICFRFFNPPRRGQATTTKYIRAWHKIKLLCNQRRRQYFSKRGHNHFRECLCLISLSFLNPRRGHAPIMIYGHGTKESYPSTKGVVSIFPRGAQPF